MKKAGMVKVTVFTPTYNRAYMIHNLYRSLQRQTFTGFEWLVIDDGSSDHTGELFQEWLEEENFFSIRYYKQSNGGKCRAINRAIDLAEGELFFTVDSDDYLTDDALQKIINWESQLPKDRTFCGVAGNLGTSPTLTPNHIFSGGYYEGTLLDRYKNVDGERAIVLYTRVHKKYKYPEFDGENFMTEAVVYNRIAHDGYKMRFYNDIIWVFEYREDGLTKAGSKMFLDNPHGYGLWLKEKAEFEHISMIEKLKMYYTFTCDLSSRYPSKTIAECIGAPLLLILFFNITHKSIQLLRKREK